MRFYTFYILQITLYSKMCVLLVILRRLSWGVLFRELLNRIRGMKVVSASKRVEGRKTRKNNRRICQIGRCLFTRVFPANVRLSAAIRVDPLCYDNVLIRSRAGACIKVASRNLWPPFKSRCSSRSALMRCSCPARSSIPLPK